MHVLALILGITCVVSGKFCSKKLVGEEWVTEGDCESGSEILSEIVKDLKERAKQQLPPPLTSSTVETTASTPGNPIVRLVNGLNTNSGRVEVYYNGKWGTVCDDDWDISDARVVCRMLGFPDAMAAPRYAFFGQGTGIIWLDNVACAGTETSLFNCSTPSWGEHYCGHSEDASVICTPIVRLVNGPNSYSGRVELFYIGEWGRVCDDDWDINDANVVCHMLGLPSAVSAPQGAIFGQGLGKVWLDNIKCTGKEISILDCSNHSTGSQSCDDDKEASVVCKTPPVRLVDGFNSQIGRVEVLYYGVWGTVCDTNWDISDANVVCNMLGFPGAISAPHRAFFGEGADKIWFDNVRCTGTETSLFSCLKNSWGEHNCYHGRDAAVVCLPPSVQLVNGRNSYSGRVEVKYNGTWGTVCDNDWDINDAHVICRMLGFANATSALLGARFGQGTNRVLFDNVGCTGIEASIWNCTKNSTTNKLCGNHKDASVVCQPTAVRLVDGGNSLTGRVEIYYQGVWGTVCDTNWDINDANVICNMLGFPGAVSAPHRAFFGEGADRIWLDNVRCTGTETSLFSCLKNPWGEHNCYHGQDASVVCSPPSIRLVNGTNSYSGRVEVKYNETWGTICDNDWDINDAKVICRMLRFANAIPALLGARFGQGTDRVLFDNVSCTGTEASIWNCAKNSATNKLCGNHKDASVVCQPAVVRLVNGGNSHSGRVEVYYQGIWGTVCDDDWDMDDANVVCRMLGFPGALSTLGCAVFEPGTDGVWLDNVKCTGAETSLFSCIKNPWGEHNCNHSEDASVVCLPLSVRLVNGTNSYSGRVEVKYNGTWGTICDNNWDINDANVICRMFGFTNSTSAPRGASFGQGNGRIWFDNVSCTGTEASILNCTKNLSAIEKCGHENDASAVCQPIAVRLVNGENSNSGRVELYYLGEWGTVCDDDWDIYDANVVCRMLGFTNATSALGQAKFGQGAGRIWLNDVMCTGTEESIWDCTKSSWGSHDCGHGEDASVICTP